MRSATDRLPRSRILLTTWVTSTEWYTGSGISSRRGAGPLRGIGDLPFLLRAVAAAGLLAVADTGGVERAADDLVTHAGEILHAAAAHEDDRVLLEVVALTGDVGRDLHTAREPDTGHLPQRGVRLLRRVRVDPGAHTPPLGRASERRGLRLRRLRLATLADQLLDGRHGGSRIVAGRTHHQPRDAAPAGSAAPEGDGGGSVLLEDLVAQVALQDLPRGVAGQFVVAQPDPHGHLERRQSLACVLLQLGDRDRRARLALHDGGDLLAEHVVGDAEHGDVHHRGVLEERRFHLGGVDVLAAADDHVLGAVRDVDEALVVEAGDVAGAQPTAVDERVGRRLRLVPVALDDVRPPHPQLPGLADGQVVAGLVHDADVVDRQRRAAAVGLGEVVDAVVRRRRRRRLGHPPAVGRRAAGEELLDAAHQFRRRGRTAIADRRHARDVGLGERR